MLISLIYYFSPTCFSNEFNMAMLLYFYFPFWKFYNILISQMVGNWILVLSNADMLCKTRCYGRIARKPRETKLSTWYQDIKSTENQVLVCEKLNTSASYSQEESRGGGGKGERLLSLTSVMKVRLQIFFFFLIACGIYEILYCKAEPESCKVRA